MSDTVSLTLRVPSDVKDKLQHLADADRRSLNFICNDALIEYIDKHTDNDKKAD